MDAVIAQSAAYSDEATLRELSASSRTLHAWAAPHLEAVRVELARQRATTRNKMSRCLYTVSRFEFKQYSRHGSWMRSYRAEYECICSHAQGIASAKHAKLEVESARRNIGVPFEWLMWHRYYYNRHDSVFADCYRRSVNVLRRKEPAPVRDLAAVKPTLAELLASPPRSNDVQKIIMCTREVKGDSRVTMLHELLADVEIVARAYDNSRAIAAFTQYVVGSK
jgi:hypothetical protein